jgi:MYXO-CTERM domain-containing protein
VVGHDTVRDGQVQARPRRSPFPCALVTDLWLRHAGGIAVARHGRSLCETLPVILATSHSEQAEKAGEPGRVVPPPPLPSFGPVCSRQRMGPRLLLAAAILSVLLGLPGAARADDGGVTPAAEIAALEAEIARSAAALATGTCAVACQALASMQRAVDRLCALDPGPRCTAAQAKTREAQRRVREACPECGTSGEAPPPVQAKTPAPQSAPPPPPPAPAEYNVSRRGGCAGCVTGGEDGVPGAGALAAVAALAVLAARSRRRRTRG